MLSDRDVRVGREAQGNVGQGGRGVETQRTQSPISPQGLVERSQLQRERHGQTDQSYCCYDNSVHVTPVNLAACAHIYQAHTITHTPVSCLHAAVHYGPVTSVCMLGTDPVLPLAIAVLELLGLLGPDPGALLQSEDTVEDRPH